MALPWALAVLSLLPLLNAQSSSCVNVPVPITNASMDQISGKWFFVAWAYRNPEYKQWASSYQSAFFYIDSNHTEDTVLIREYSTINDQCLYNSTHLNIQKENGTLSRYYMGREHFAYLILTKDPSIFMFAFYPEDKENISLSFFANKTEVTQEQRRQFHEHVICMGMDKSEIVYVDEKQDQCGPLDKQHEEERKKEKDPKGPKEGGK
ncbi:orosomucoid 1 [Rhinolophus ferrumequinum]|uniref:Orosomucoid 1 n=1 Tax=Rhinolophus ferrumequinum TaxID=59479 RepID=A0A671FJC2_RHIFE|nr:alpha-1-acid glycoprotein 1-like [Rhinolophus ferrumequinum]KAF6327826.1 orosomucoid 1 [Rhinolophus ferrumequinum]